MRSLSNTAWTIPVHPMEILAREAVQQPGLRGQGFVIRPTCYPPFPLPDMHTPFSIGAVSLPITCLSLEPLLPPQPPNLKSEGLIAQIEGPNCTCLSKATFVYHKGCTFPLLQFPWPEALRASSEMEGINYIFLTLLKYGRE